MLLVFFHFILIWSHLLFLNNFWCCFSSFCFCFWLFLFWGINFLYMNSFCCFHYFSYLVYLTFIIIYWVLFWVAWIYVCLSVGYYFVRGMCCDVMSLYMCVWYFWVLVSFCIQIFIICIFSLIFFSLFLLFLYNYINS